MVARLSALCIYEEIRRLTRIRYENEGKGTELGSWKIQVINHGVNPLELRLIAFTVSEDEGFVHSTMIAGENTSNGVYFECIQVGPGETHISIEGVKVKHISHLTESRDSACVELSEKLKKQRGELCRITSEKSALSFLHKNNELSTNIHRFKVCFELFAYEEGEFVCCCRLFSSSVNVLKRSTEPCTREMVNPSQMQTTSDGGAMEGESSSCKRRCSSKSTSVHVPEDGGDGDYVLIPPLCEETSCIIPTSVEEINQVMSGCFPQQQVLSASSDDQSSYADNEFFHNEEYLVSRPSSELPDQIFSDEW